MLGYQASPGMGLSIVGQVKYLKKPLMVVIRNFRVTNQEAGVLKNAAIHESTVLVSALIVSRFCQGCSVNSFPGLRFRIFSKFCHFRYQLYGHWFLKWKFDGTC